MSSPSSMENGEVVLAAAVRVEAADSESKSTSPLGVREEGRGSMGGAKEPVARASMSSSAR